MKAVQWVLNAIFGIGILYLVITVNSNCQKEEQVEEVEEVISQEQNSNLLYVNTDTLWKNYKLVDELREDLAQRKNQYNNDFENKLRAFEQEVVDFQKNAATMSQFEGQQKQKELLEKEQSLAKLEEELSMRLMEMEDKMKRDLRNKILAYLRNNKQDGVDFVLDYSTNGSLLTVNDSLDITASVLNGLNAAYESSKNKD